MKTKTYLAALLLICSYLSAQNWLEICNQTFSKTGNDVSSYDVTMWTGDVDFNSTRFDSICVLAHSEKINDNTSALVFSRWFIKNNFMGSNTENYVLQDTLIFEQGTQIDQVKFPACSYGYSFDNYEFEYLYFSRTKNNQTDFCRVKHLGNGNFAQPEIITNNMQSGNSFSAKEDLFLYNYNGKVFLKNLTAKTLSVLDSGNCQNPQILATSAYENVYFSWEKAIGDTVKTYYVEYNSLDHTIGVIKQFYIGDVRNLRKNPRTIWETGTGNSRKTLFTEIWSFTPLSIYQVLGNPQFLQTVQWYGEYCSYQTGEGDSSKVFLKSFPYGDYYNIDGLVGCKNPSFKQVGVYVVMGYAPWTYLKKINGKYQLQSKMLYLPEAGIDDADEKQKQSLLISGYPNPFNNSTRINYNLPQTGLTTISVYNSSGQLVKNICNKLLQAGEHSIEFKADNLTSGVYYIRINNSGEEKSLKLMLIK